MIWILDVAYIIHTEVKFSTLSSVQLGQKLVKCTGNGYTLLLQYCFLEYILAQESRYFKLTICLKEHERRPEYLAYIQFHHRTTGDVTDLNATYD